jgi:hypothetical protein
MRARTWGYGTHAHTSGPGWRPHLTPPASHGPRHSPAPACPQKRDWFNVSDINGRYRARLQALKAVDDHVEALSERAARGTRCQHTHTRTRLLVTR